MKALSIKNPWAWLLQTGKKTIETRTWRTDHRGKILICVSKQDDDEAMQWLHGIESIDFKTMKDQRGMAIAIARLYDCRKMSERDESAAQCGYDESLFSWCLSDIETIKPFKVRGQLGLFDVDISERGEIKRRIQESDKIFWQARIASGRRTLFDFDQLAETKI